MWWVCVWGIFWVCCHSFLVISTDVTALVEEIQKGEPLITASCLEHVVHLVQRLQDKLGEKQNHKFSLFKVRGVFQVILGILGGLSCDTVSRFLLLCIVPEGKIGTLWLISWHFSIPSALPEQLSLAWLFLPGIPPERLRSITVSRHCLHRLMH